MRQILQNLRDGSTEIAEVPAPIPNSGHVLIATTVSLVSAGTERMLVDFGKGSLVSKARQQPDKVRQALQKIKTDGVFTTIDAINAKLDQPLALGYCNVGRVLTAGEGYQVGERVVSNGKHAEVVSVPRNLVARIPHGVEDADAALTVLGAIALQGIRLLNPTVGECVVVTGLGLIGLMAVQILKANGCRVLGIDTNPQRLELARKFGAEVVDLSAGEDPLSRAQAFSRARGVDAVLITASTSSNEPVSQAAQMSRKRGRIVLVGVTGLELNRADFYEKELTFQVSCSYGPGRYDPDYEDHGQDYPYGFVRWTVQRNFEAVLDLLASGVLDVKPLISHWFDISDASNAYKVLTDDPCVLGILIRYPEQSEKEICNVQHIQTTPDIPTLGRVVTGFIGAGNYGGRILLNAFSKSGAILHTIVSQSGVSATHYGRKFGFSQIASDASIATGSDTIDTIVISTRHDSHARLVLEALEANKNVYVEKPLCLTLDELSRIAEAASKSGAQRLMVGFNRRFAPMVVEMKKRLDALTEPKSLIMTVNAGAIPNDHWTQDPQQGGGRILGEACHFIDLLRFLVGTSIVSFQVTRIKPPGGPPQTDIATITLEFKDGSFGVVNYLANGHKGYPKERLEVFVGGRILLLENYRKLSGFGWKAFDGKSSWRQDKGQKACVMGFVDSIRDGKPSPIPLNELIEVSRIAIEVAEQAG